MGPNPSVWAPEAWLIEASIFGAGSSGQAPLCAASPKFDLGLQSHVDQSLLTICLQLIYNELLIVWS